MFRIILNSEDVAGATILSEEDFKKLLTDFSQFLTKRHDETMILALQAVLNRINTAHLLGYNAVSEFEVLVKQIHDLQLEKYFEEKLKKGEKKLEEAKKIVNEFDCKKIMALLRLIFTGLPLSYIASPHLVRTLKEIVGEYEEKCGD